LRGGPTIQPSATVTLAQAIAANIAGLQKPFNPEYATNYEVGAKTSWFDHRLTANVSIYRENFKDLQVLIASITSGNLVLKEAGNAGRTRSQGLDLEIRAAPTPWLRLGATYSYLEAKYLVFSPQGVNRAGNSLPDAPKNTLNLSAAGDWDFDWGTFSAGGDVTFRSKVFGDESNSDAPQVLAKTTINGLLNGSVDFKTRDGRWDLRLWGRNLTDTRYATAFSVFASTARAFGFTGPYYADASWNDPRTLGATVTYNMH
jgi:iron complex outermembrane receptor protein